MVDLLAICKDCKIDFSKTVVICNDPGGTANYLHIRPKEFTRYAKEDFLCRDNRALINAISNAKRAIDCQIDTAFNHFGISFDTIPSAAHDYCNHFNFSNKDLPLKLRLIQSMSFTPSGLLSNIRNLRNKLEHYYEIPSEREVQDAIELAELFVLSMEHKISYIERGLIISSSDFHQLTGNEKDISLRSIDYYTGKTYSNRVHISFDEAKKIFTIKAYKNNRKHKEVSFDSSNKLHYCFINLINNLSDDIDTLNGIKTLLKIINHPIPESSIRVNSYLS
ncbi:hypothetical protein HMJ29_10640 [Hymenobacter taeanensis]|uniref:DUF4145 domain-containing protein n=1 Tax=Hymenobacter taeanensis TaxID=2735321 RepID=A0A6M6BH47_9BACT|nr:MULTISPECIES: hypothetical protein [Hymenobacter]QJX47370.1 hypothetical protein HMJ29_10640 [Hymenobacter taeanensis]UOQ79290.1 hypothetical protein MUN83_10470 [Hymenobacter sp. 5414T-23]